MEIFTKLLKKTSIGISDFGYKTKEKYSIYVSRNFREEKHEEGKREE